MIRKGRSDERRAQITIEKMVVIVMAAKTKKVIAMSTKKGIKKMAVDACFKCETMNKEIKVLKWLIDTS